MNWQEVKKYPKAWEKFEEYANTSLCPFTQNFVLRINGNWLVFFQKDNAWGSEVDYRRLFDFFDEQGIRVFIDFLPYRRDREKVQYYYKIQYYSAIKDWEYNYSKEKLYPTRTEAEGQAFLRAFQLLEEKLKEGK